MDEPVEEPSGTTESAAKVNNMSAAVENKSELITNAEVYPIESTSKKDWCCFQSCCRTNTNITREQMTGAGAMESRSLLVPSHLMEQQQTSGYIKWTALIAQTTISIYLLSAARVLPRVNKTLSLFVVVRKIGSIRRTR